MEASREILGFFRKSAVYRGASITTSIANRELCKRKPDRFTNRSSARLPPARPATKRWCASTALANSCGVITMVFAMAAGPQPGGPLPPALTLPAQTLALRPNLSHTTGCRFDRGSSVARLRSNTTLGKTRAAPRSGPVACATHRCDQAAASNLRLVARMTPSS